MQKIVIFIDWFLPAYKAGGPIRSVSNMINLLHNDYKFYVVTSDRDLGDNSSMQDIETNQWIVKDTHSIIYLKPEKQNLKDYKKILEKIDFDIVYFNSLFSVKFTLLPLFLIKKHFGNKKTILAPRGMLGKGALEIKSFKKNLFLKLSSITGFFNNVRWHATSNEEEIFIKKFFKNAEIVVAPNLPEKPPLYQQKDNLEVIKMFFLSRILSIKNLKFALEILQSLRTNKKIIYDIYGPIEDKQYWTECEVIIKNMPINIKVNYKGNLKPDKIFDVIRKYHFFFMPTKHENFGHSIYEALAAGCPVIISDQTFWQNLEYKNAGWDIALNNKEKFLKVLNSITKIDFQQYQKMSESAYKLALQYFNNQSNTNQYQKLFSETKHNF